MGQGLVDNMPRGINLEIPDRSETRTLAALRDALLPKLVSGVVRFG